jgi:hypothetical protein
MFAQIAKRQSQHGVQLWLTGMNPGVLAIVQRSPMGQMLQREGMHFNLEIAVSRYLMQLCTTGRQVSQAETDLIWCRS